MVGDGFASAVADLHGFKVSRRLGLLLWAIVHLALIPNRENRITLSINGCTPWQPGNGPRFC